MADLFYEAANPGAVNVPLGNRPYSSTMLKRTQSAALRLVMALIMAFGVMPWPDSSSSHAPLSLLQIVAISIAPDSHEHDHAHDDSAPNAHRHAHGHNPTDHSHENPSPAITMTSADLAMLRLWRPSDGDVPASAPPFRLDRPPRTLAAS